MVSNSNNGMSKYVTLRSSDGFEFVVLREAACRSGAIRRMLDPKSAFREAAASVCTFEEINGIILDKVAEYFYYNHKNRNQEDVPDMDIPPELCLELLMAADFLDSLFTVCSSLHC
ncbi:putative Elongin-C [Calycina marina]|uniref:Elongin-C n=1 Tax=Calycina marina TaxID=1763456 RepID=A0A9P7Z1A2_9HELO|nr:putative Elongin-C [Calycina marina]